MTTRGIETCREGIGRLRTDDTTERLAALLATHAFVDELLGDARLGEDEATRAMLIDAQSDLLRRAAVMRARSLAGLLHKMNLWRADNDDLVAPDATAGDRLAVSALEDLRAMVEPDRSAA